MKTPDDLDRLLDDVLSPDSSEAFRDRTLAQGLVALRRRKRQRMLTRRIGLGAIMAIPVAGLVMLLAMTARHQTPSVVPVKSASAPPANRIPGTDIRIITDDELFALFPNRPLALVGPKGHQQLIFLDEQPPSQQ